MKAHTARQILSDGSGMTLMKVADSQNRSPEAVMRDAKSFLRKQHKSERNRRKNGG